MHAKPIIFIVGPTAAGKTSLSIRVAKACNGEIISADSMQVYRGMDIGTDKVSKEVTAKIPHHLIDFIDPSNEFTAFDYMKSARACIVDIVKRNRFPVVVGGSGLYIRALIDGIAAYPSGSRALRDSLKEEADEYGLAALHARLQSLDPERADRIHCNDERRIIRALEIYSQSGKTPSQHATENTSLEDEGFSLFMIGIMRSRDSMYRDAEQRVDEMIRNGLIDEVTNLKDTMSPTTSQAVGYKELINYLNGTCSLNEAVCEIKKNTRHLIKKQMTWFRKETRITWWNRDEYSDEKKMFDSVLTAISQWMSDGKSFSSDSNPKKT